MDHHKKYQSFDLQYRNQICGGNSCEEGRVSSGSESDTPLSILINGAGPIKRPRNFFLIGTPLPIDFDLERLNSM